MLCNWNPEEIRWYQTANTYTEFFKNIATVVTPKLEGYSTLCDIGCGLGLFDLEICNIMKNITCIDINSAPIDELKKNIEESNIRSIHPIVMNSDDINDHWDVIFISFYGSSCLERFLPYCKKLIAVVCGGNKTELYPQKYRVFKKNTVDRARQNFDDKGIPYSLTEVSFEFGQPFRSIDDASNFVINQSSEIARDEAYDFLKNKLVHTGDAKFPLFLPHMKSLGIFEFDGNAKS